MLDGWGNPAHLPDDHLGCFGYARLWLKRNYRSSKGVCPVPSQPADSWYFPDPLVFVSHPLAHYAG